MHVITRLLHCNTLRLRHPSAAIYKSTYPCFNGHTIFTMASSSSLFITIALLALLVSWQATAYDPSPLQDFCVADMKSPGMCVVYIRTGIYLWVSFTSSNNVSMFLWFILHAILILKQKIISTYSNHRFTTFSDSWCFFFACSVCKWISLQGPNGRQPRRLLQCGHAWPT